MRLILSFTSAVLSHHRFSTWNCDFVKSSKRELHRYEMRLILSFTSAVLSVIQLGYALVVMNTMLDHLTEDLNFNKNRGGALASAIFYFGCGVGGLIASRFERALGRFSQTGVASMYFSGSLLCGFSNSRSFCWGGPLDGCVPFMLFFGRILVGIGGGLGSVISPKYLAEIAPPRIRGLLAVISEVLEIHIPWILVS